MKKFDGMKARPAIFLTGAMLLSGASALPIYAQDAEPEADRVMEEVIVMGRLRSAEESLQD